MWSISIGTAGLMLIMLSASFHDVRSREIPDIHWAMGGTLAVWMSAVSAYAYGATAAVEVAAGAVILSVYMLCERIPGIVAVPASALCYLAASRYDAVYAATAAATVSVLVMYHIGLIRGGADAKALVTLAMAYPSYPDIAGLPLVFQPEAPVSYVLGPAFSILTMALVLALVPVFPIACTNALGGRFGKGMFSTLELNIEDAGGRFVWPLEDMVDGRKTGIPAGCDDPSVYRRLEDAGYKEVLVTPIVPFVLPIAVSFILVIVIGNPLFALAA